MTDREGLAEGLAKAISNYYSARRGTQHDKSYQAKFYDDGLRKAGPVLEYVRPRFANLAFLIYVSVGGADGSEAAAVLRDSPINHAILLEFSDEGTSQARAYAKELAKRGKRLTVLQGDATQRLDDCCAYLEELREEGISGIVCSAQAILHELPF